MKSILSIIFVFDEKTTTTTLTQSIIENLDINPNQFDRNLDNNWRVNPTIFNV